MCSEEAWASIKTRVGAKGESLFLLTQPAMVQLTTTAQQKSGYKELEVGRLGRHLFSSNLKATTAAWLTSWPHRWLPQFQDEAGSMDLLGCEIHLNCYLPRLEEYPKEIGSTPSCRPEENWALDQVCWKISSSQKGRKGRCGVVPETGTWCHIKNIWTAAEEEVLD